MKTVYMNGKQLITEPNSKTKIVNPKTPIPVTWNNRFDSFTVRGDFNMTQAKTKTSHPKWLCQIQKQIPDII